MERPGLPVCIITGFLGSGKTTLLNHILRNQQGARVAVFVNEFGATDIDGDLIRWQGSIDEARVVTLDNGCMCCEVNDDLERQLRRVLQAQAAGSTALDLLVIETSGLCDPAPVLTTLQQLEDVAVSVHLDSVVTVVDASDYTDMPETAKALGLQETASRQLRQCDLLLLNKCDLVGGLNSERAVHLEERLAAALEDRPVRLLRCEHGNVDLALISSVEARQERAPKRPRLAEASSHSAHGLRTSAVSFVYTADRPFNPLLFEEWVEAGGPPKSICRAKGLLWMQGIPRHVIFQLSGCRTNPFETVPGGSPPSSSRLVFIGAPAALEEEAKVRRALDACLAGRESSENRRAGVTAAGPFGVSTTREVGRFFLLVCTCELTQKGTYHALEVSWKGDVCSHTQLCAAFCVGVLNSNS
ncbi:unnamed protein product [Effrenium voratum]|nr:unnamed protein product [Effrenium voratum]